MCTVTIVRHGDGLRLACNRDEEVARPAARPPRSRRFGRRRAILPIDPRGGGTWIAASDAGLALALLNVTPDRGAASLRRARRIRRPRTISRGRIIPALLRSGSLDEAVAAARRIDPRRYLPFRLVIADRREVAVLNTIGGRLRLRRRPLRRRPLLFTSSGLGDRLVEGPRRALFRRMLGGAPPSRRLARQEEFHRHRWPGRPHLSVDMRRPGARTVCHAAIDLTAGGARFVFRSGGPGGRPGRLIDLPMRGTAAPPSWRRT